MPHDPLAWIDDELGTLAVLKLRRQLRTRAGRQGPEVTIDGQRALNFGSNDYLGLAADPRLAEAVQSALQQDPSHGWGSGASPLIAGRSELHAALERELAAFEGTEAAMVFPSGFAANVGAITALATRGDVVFSDAKNHASIIDGCRLCGARVQVYPHSDMQYLEQMLTQASAFRRRLIVTDTLFSMDGDFAPLGELAELASQYDCMLLVDEAHATGVFGEHGRGVAEMLDAEDGVHIRVGTLSKALGSAGGFVAGTQSLVDWLANRARPYVFSTAPPGAWCAAGLKSLEIVREEPDRRDELHKHVGQVRTALGRQGWQVGAGESQIIPVFIGEPELTMKMADRLLRRGIFVPGIRPPSVPDGESLLRISLSAAHTDQHLQSLLSAFDELRRGVREDSVS